MFFVTAWKGKDTTACILRFSDNFPGSCTHSAEGSSGSGPLLFNIK